MPLHRVVFLTAASSSPWTVPEDCWLLELVEVLGAGQDSVLHGRSGDGADYAGTRAIAVSPGQLINFGVGVHGNPGGDTWFGGDNYGNAYAAAKGGGGIKSPIGDVTHAGGAGHDLYSLGKSGMTEAAGGGAAGPHGDGEPGHFDNNMGTGDNSGGFSDGNWRGRVGSDNVYPMLWTQSSDGAQAGPGDGGITQAGGAGANGYDYGGGAGAFVSAVYDGGPGIIVISYTTMPSGGSYTGPGDYLAAVAWGGLRAYSAAYAAPGTNPAIDVQRASDSATATINILADGNIDVAALRAFLLFTTGVITKVYDQTGNGCDFLVAGDAPAVNVMGRYGYMPYMEWSTGAVVKLESDISAVLSGLPFSVMMLLRRQADFTRRQIAMYINNGVYIHLRFNETTPSKVQISSGTARIGDAEDNKWHRIGAVYANDGAGKILVDGAVAVAGATGANTPGGFVADFGGTSGANTFYGGVSEIGIWDGDFTVQAADIDADAAFYWEPPPRFGDFGDVEFLPVQQTFDVKVIVGVSQVAELEALTQDATGAVKVSIIEPEPGWVDNIGSRNWATSWHGLAMSDDGWFIIGGDQGQFGGLIMTHDGGTTWERAPINADPINIGAGSFRRVTCSGDGRKIFASVGGINVTMPWRSLDYGRTWSRVIPPSYVFDVAYSADGSKLIATGDGTVLIMSDNDGSSWTVCGAPTAPNWRRVAISGDGQIIYAVVGSNSVIGPKGLIYKSDDGGTSFTQVGDQVDRCWNGLACSRDGVHVVAAATADVDPGIWVSHDSGATWHYTSINGGVDGWNDCACSGDGRVMVVSNGNQNALNQGLGMWVSFNYGVTWEESLDEPAAWRSPRVTIGGRKVAVAAGAGEGAGGNGDIWIGYLRHEFPRVAQDAAGVVRVVGGQTATFEPVMQKSMPRRFIQTVKGMPPVLQVAVGEVKIHGYAP